MPKKKPKTYRFVIPCSWEMYGTYEVEAPSLDEAVTIAENSENLPEDGGSYVDGSFTINHDMMLLNEGTLEVIKVDQAPVKELPLLVGQLKTKAGTNRLEQRLKEI